MPDVIVPLEHAPPAECGEEPFGAGVVRPEFRQMGAGIHRTFLESRQEAVGVTVVALLGEGLRGEDEYALEVTPPAPEPVTKPPDPVPDLVAENEVALVDGTGPAACLLLLLEELGVPGGEVAILLHFPDRELAHGPQPSGVADFGATLVPLPSCLCGEGHSKSASREVTVPAALLFRKIPLPGTRG